MEDATPKCKIPGITFGIMFCGEGLVHRFLVPLTIVCLIPSFNFPALVGEFTLSDLQDKPLAQCLLPAPGARLRFYRAYSPPAPPAGTRLQLYRAYSSGYSMAPPTRNT